ncbi:unnamed protein product [Meloidogyne enterolobii]|uniref:Uncharacterized protein n=1 Tax=Meloidogyne enterolobii TaxID=390850 RepID=A0ACB1A4T5_MELEN
MSNSTPSATTTTGYNSSPSLSPQRKVSRSARLCHSFRRTLRRNSPGGKKALAQTDSNASAPTALLSSLGEQQQLLNSDVNKGSQNSVLNAVMNARTSSFSQLQQKESRLASSEVSKKDDSVEQTPEKKQQQKQQADDNRRNSSSSPLSRLFFNFNF